MSGVAWYRLRFELPARPEGPQAVMARRLGGDGAIYVNGKLVGQNRVTRMHKECVIFENYRAGEFSGSSLNVYDADRKVWHHIAWASALDSRWIDAEAVSLQRG